jgi:hypothetical protein
MVSGLAILLTMRERTTGKLNRLLERLGDTTLVSSRWLREHGYPSNLVDRYVARGWLQSPERGVYLRKGGTPTWEGLLRSLQTLEGLPVHAGGRFALARQGHEHFLRFGEPATLTDIWTGKKICGTPNYAAAGTSNARVRRMYNRASLRRSPARLVVKRDRPRPLAPTALSSSSPPRSTAP